ncbi:hypothetical protein H2201_009323, partial [Coniosporium apollinis]
MNAQQRKSRRLRCLGHVINLAAQVFLLGKKAEDTLDSLALAHLRHDYEKIAAIWRKQGVFGRVHNIVRYIRMTPQRRAEFKKVKVDDVEWEQFNGLG